MTQILLELARVDTSLSTFFLVHNCLAIQSIALCASDEQKQRYLPAMIRLDKVGCFALTEPERGSDASSLLSTAKPVEGGWVLNGRKRWIGNATFADVFIVWAKHAETGAVLGFVVDKGSPGLSATKIENKISLRIVQNGDIVMKDVFVPEKFDAHPLAQLRLRHLTCIAQEPPAQGEGFRIGAGPGTDGVARNGRLAACGYCHGHL